MSRWLRCSLGILAAIALCVAGLFALRARVCVPYTVPSMSMAPTLLKGDSVLAWRPRGEPQLERGMVIAFRYPKDRELTYVKRVIGLPGDEVQFVDNRPVITGLTVQQTHSQPMLRSDDSCRSQTTTQLIEQMGQRSWKISRDAKPSLLANAQRIVVPPGQLYVVGDNRDHSQDSRAWGFVPIADVVGVVDRVWMSSDPCTGKTRPERIGAVK